MSAMKLNLPAGIDNNGTGYSTAGRWIDCNLVRWNQGVLNTIGGWQQRLTNEDGTPLLIVDFDPMTEAVRSGIAVFGLTGNSSTFFGSNKEIYLLPDGDPEVIVTPAEFDAQEKDATSDGGYGDGSYGDDAYGTPRLGVDTIPKNVFSWGFAAWGTTALACARSVGDQHIYKFDQGDTLFTEVATSPLGAAEVLVTDERMVMLLGTADDKRLVTWSDQEDYTNYTAATTNTAGEYRLAGAGNLVAARKVQNQILILGENDAFVGRFIGPPYIYGFDRIGSNCGAICANAVAAASDLVMWYGRDSFWLYDGALRPVPCPVLDYFSSDASKPQISKINAFVNPEFDEIWWLYQSVNGLECDSYLIYNYREGSWYYGKVNRTYALFNAALKYPMMVSDTGCIYDHEIQNAGYDGETPFIATGPLELANGDRLLGMSYLYPDDTGAQDDVTMTVDIRDFPTGAIKRSVSYQLTDPVSTTGIMGRDLRLTFRGNGNMMWKLGTMRVVPVNSPTGRR